MKRFKLFKLLALFVVLITSINTAWGQLYGTGGQQESAIQSQQLMSGGAYNGTVYEPFDNTTPSEQSEIGASYSPGRAASPKKSRTPGEASSGSPDSPIGDPLVLTFFALGFAGLIFIRKRRQINKITDMKNSTKYIATLIMLVTFGIGHMRAGRTFNGGEILYFTNVKYSNDSEYGYAEAKLVLRTTSESNDGATFVPLTAVANNSGYYQAIIPAGTWNHMLIFRTNATKWEDCSWHHAGGSDCWNNTWQKDIDGTANLLDGAKEGTNNGTWKWMIPKGATFYIDKTNIGTWGANYYLRIGRTTHCKKYDFSSSLVTGTDRLYKCTVSDDNYIDYEAFVVSNNYGWTGSNTIYNLGSVESLITYQVDYVKSTTLNGLSFTFVPSSSTSSGDGGKCTYYNRTTYQGDKIYTITNTAVTGADVELYYWDEEHGEGMANVQIVPEGESVKVRPTTKVWCKVTPDPGKVVTKVMLTDGGAEREWTDASNDGSGRNLYVVRKDVSFRAVIDDYETKTILVKDVKSWAPNMYFKGWNPFLYEGYDNAQYHYTTQKVSDKITLTCGDYYVVTISNEFPFYYIHDENDNNQTAFFTPQRLTHMAKYDNHYSSGEGSWDLRTAPCNTDPIYWVETYKGTGPKYISNIVSNTTDTMSFYVESGATVDFHSGGSDPVNQYSSVFAKYFASKAQLDGKAGGVFTATTTGSALTNDTIFDGDYHIHVNATTRNYLTAGASNDGTTGTKFIKFDKSSLFGDSFDHYWVDWFLGEDDSYGEQSVVATVGNKYNGNLAGVLGADAYAPKGKTQEGGGNVRYGYDPETNFFERAIVASGNTAVKIKSNTAVTDNDSVMISTNNGSTYTENATSAQNFKDATNWNYQVYARVRGGSHATVTTSYVAGTQTLASQKKLIGGSGSSTYDVIVTYDFKTNRLIAAWNPDPVAGFVGFDLESNLMAVRTENGAPTVLNMQRDDVDKRKKTLSKITKIYTVMEFLQDNWKSNANSNCRVDADSWCDEYYWIALPYDCYIGDIFGIEGYGSGDYDSWVLQRYRGDLRAKKGWWAETEDWWEDMARTDTLKAGQGYVLRVTNLNGEHIGTKRFAGTSGGKLYLYFPSMDNNLSLGLVLDGSYNLATSMTSSIPEHKCEIWRGKDAKPDPTNEGNPRYDRRAIDSNWNIIGSPSFNSTKITSPTWGETYPTSPNVKGDLKFFYTWATNVDPKYTVKTNSSFSSFEFKATHAYLAQYAGDITWVPYNDSNPLVELKAPKRTTEENGDQTLQLVLMHDTLQADVTYISRMAEGATEGYDLNLDLSKLLSNTGNNLYTIAGYYQMAGNCIPDTTSIIPVGVKLAQGGDYTFSMPEGTNGVGVVLVDNVANTRTNLALTDYTVSLTEGQYDERFVLEISPIQNTPTGIEKTADDKNNICKKMVDGTLYIVKDGRIFDARGNRIH